MKKQTVLALSLLVSMGATNAVPAWMSSVGTRVSTAARTTGSAIATAARTAGGAIATGATTVWHNGRVQGAKGWVVATQPAQFVANRPVAAGVYATGVTAAVLARKQLARAARYVGTKVNDHRRIAGAVAVTLAAGIGAAVWYDKVPTCVNNGVSTFGTDVRNAGTFCVSNLWTGAKGTGSWLNDHRKITTAGILAGLGYGLNRLGARRQAAVAHQQQPVAAPAGQ